MSSLPADIEWFRAEQARLFICVAQVTRGPAGPPVFDEGTGLYTASGDPTEVYQGPCSIRPPRPRRSGFERVTGEEELRFEWYEGKFPADTPLRMNDEVLVQLCPFDAGLVGRILRMSSVELDTRQIARVCALEEVER